MNQQNNTQINKPIQSSKNIRIIVVSVVIIAFAVGGGVYWWRSSIAKRSQNKMTISQQTLQLRIDNLQNQISELKNNSKDNSEEEKNQIVNGVDYLEALRTADLFLSASIHRDGEKGYSLLSKRLKDLYSEDRLLTAISGLSNPHHHSFEIFNPRSPDNNSFEFQIFFNDWYTGQQFDLNLGKRKPETLKVVKGKEGKWYVDSLPESIALYIVEYKK